MKKFKGSYSNIIYIISIIMFCLLLFYLSNTVTDEKIENNLTEPVKETVQEIRKPDINEQKEDKFAEKISINNTSNSVQTKPESPECIVKIENLCIISKIFLPEGLPCKDYAAEFNMDPQRCRYNGRNQAKAPYDTTRKYIENMSDRYIGSRIACKRMGGHIPNSEEMDKILRAFYGECGVTRAPICSYQLDKSLSDKLGVDPERGFSLWLSEQYHRSFDAMVFKAHGQSPSADSFAHYSWVGTICIAD